jgi:hypothetical protein
MFPKTIASLFRIRRQLIIFLISCSAVFLGFNYNIYRVSLPEELANFGKVSESLVVGRLVETQRNGLFSEGGFLGFVHQEGDSTEDFHKQYRIYLENLDYKNYHVYRTITGFNGFVFGLIDEATDFSNRFNLALFRFINSALAAVSIAFVLVFIYYYIGLLPWLLALLSVIFSIALTPFGSNLFFCLWAFYLPLIIVISILVYEDVKGRYSRKSAFIFILVAVIIKGLFNGMEFITSILIMMMVPLFFFMVRNKWPFELFLKRFMFYSLTALLGVLFNLAILSAQIAIYDGSAKAGIDHIVKSWHKRTGGEPSAFEFDPLVQKSLRIKSSLVLNTQFKKAAYRIGPDNQAQEDGHRGLIIKYSHLLAIFGLAILLLLLLIKAVPCVKEKQVILAMVTMTLVSVLAPFSWFIIFKGHTYIHYNLDNLVWYFPFVILGAATVGLLLKTISTIFYLKILKGKL